MKKLIVKLEAIRAIAKTIHYEYEGENFYSIHKLMDRVSKDIYDWQDAIKEDYFMCYGLDIPSFIDIYSATINTLQDKDINLQTLKDEINSTIALIEELCSTEGFDNNEPSNLTQGVLDLLGEISRGLGNSQALLSKQI